MLIYPDMFLIYQLFVYVFACSCSLIFLHIRSIYKFQLLFYVKHFVEFLYEAWISYSNRYSCWNSKDNITILNICMVDGCFDIEITEIRQTKNNAFKYKVKCLFLFVWLYVQLSILVLKHFAGLAVQYMFFLNFSL